MNYIKLTFDSIKKANLLKYIILSFTISVLIILLFVLFSTWLINNLLTIDIKWLKNTITALSGLIFGVGGWFMFPTITIAVSAIFQEYVIHNIEKEYYPEQKREKEPSFFTDIKHDLKFVILSIGLNILIIPLYFFGIGFIISIILNSYLLGREIFELVIGYHIGKPEAKKIENKFIFTVYFNGLLFSIASIIPIINLFVPIMATVWETHYFHKKWYNKILNSNNNNEI